MATQKPPTTAEVRKAFRAALDAVDLDGEARQIALEAFKSNLRPEPVKRRTRRQEQNQAARDIQTLSDIMPDLLEQALHVIKRNDFTSGERVHRKDELWGPIAGTEGNDMTGTSEPYYGDPTGEEACWDERDDRTGIIISAMCTALSQWLTMAQSIHDLSNTDVRVRAAKSMPDCLACGDPCLGRVLSGFDEKCYKRFVRAGRPDRNVFIQAIKEEKSLEEVSTANDVGK